MFLLIAALPVSPTNWRRERFFILKICPNIRNSCKTLASAGIQLYSFKKHSLSSKRKLKSINVFFSYRKFWSQCRFRCCWSDYCCKGKNKSSTGVCNIPLVFAVQQLTEGLLWLSLKNTDMASRAIFSYLYLPGICDGGVAILDSLTIRLLEKDPGRKE